MKEITTIAFPSTSRLLHELLAHVFGVDIPHKAGFVLIHLSDVEKLDMDDPDTYPIEDVTITSVKPKVDVTVRNFGEALALLDKLGVIEKDCIAGHTIIVTAHGVRVGCTAFSHEDAETLVKLSRQKKVLEEEVGDYKISVGPLNAAKDGSSDDVAAGEVSVEGNYISVKDIDKINQLRLKALRQIEGPARRKPRKAAKPARK